MPSSSCCGCSSFAESEFELLHYCKANGMIPVKKYVSKSTGLVVIHAAVEGPIINGYICVVTKAGDNDGLPHTLEHLIFLGSEDYPYPGVLDRISNKCFASGANAWTDVDHTCFTISTVGSNGFCQILPIYLDHVFYPLLTEAAFKTEVHHVTARGTDAGVVYSEMQALQYTGYSQATNELYKTLFSPTSGYHWNVGGSLTCLTESCNNDKVKAFHKKFYHPSNTCLIVCGSIQLDDLFSALYLPIKKMRENAKAALKPNVRHSPSKSSSLHLETCEKPWLMELNQINEVAEPTEKTVLFPATDIEGGCTAVIGFLGPSSIILSELEDACGILLILKYLSNNSGSPLQQAFVEKQLGLATSLTFMVHEYSRATFCFEIDGIKPHDKSRIVKLLRQTIEAQLKTFDMSKMANVIQGGIQNELSAMENMAHDCIAQAAIRDFIYGSSEFGDCNCEGSSFTKRLNGVAMLERFLSFPKSYWEDLIREKILAKNWVTVFAEPSIDLHTELVEQREERISKRKQAIGDLVHYARELDEALLLNSMPMPEKVIKQITVPSLKAIRYHHIIRLKNPTWIYVSDFPANICFDDIVTKFVHVYLVMDTSELDSCFREYIPLFKEVLLNSPILDGKHLIPYEQVVTERSRDLIACELNVGLDATDILSENDYLTSFSSGSYSHLLVLGIQMEMDKVEVGMGWIKKILWRTKWQMDRVRTAIHKLIGEILLLRREGNRMCQMILKNVVYEKESNVTKTSLMTQLKFLNSLEADDDKRFKGFENEIRTAFDSILSVITDPNNISLHMATNLKELRGNLAKLSCNNLGTLLKNSFPFENCPEEERDISPKTRRIANSDDSTWMLTPDILLKHANNNQIIYGMGSENTSYLLMVGPGITSYHSSELPALLTLLQYMTIFEGPIYSKIRGRGYAYAYDAALRVNEGLIYFCLTRCSDIVAAYGSVFRVIADHQSKLTSLWSSEQLISAKSSLLFQCLEVEKTPLTLASNSCLAYYRKVPGTFIRTLIAKIAKVKLRDLRKMFKKYLAPMFQTKSRNYSTVVACPLNQVEAVKQGFETYGKNMRVFKSFDSLVSGLGSANQ